MIKKAIKFLQKNISNSFFRARFIYTKFYKKLPIDNNIILLESARGKSVNGNIFYILKELVENEEYKSLNIYITTDISTEEAIKVFLDERKICNVNLVNVNSLLYCKVLASAKYLINDTSFLPYFIKKEGQVYLNTWHGTPLKTLGKRVRNEPHLIGNVQKNFLMSDYLLYPNEFTMNHMQEDYMIKDLFNNKVLLTGYPRNSVFFDDELRKHVRNAMEISEMQVIAYMPTWRGSLNNTNKIKQQSYMYVHLYEIDKRLNDNQVLYVNLHPFVEDIMEYKHFKHIKPFPKSYETYEFLNATDCLITDYSSVFFDYASTKRKIILFDYDREEYLNERGMYLDIDDLPFPKVQDFNSLINEINSKRNYDDKEFIKEFCLYDSMDSARKLSEKVILNKENDIVEYEISENKKENVLIYAGNLAKNGITTSLLSLLNNIDLEKRNYYLTFNSRPVKKHVRTIEQFPENLSYIVRQGMIDYTYYEALVHFLYIKLGFSNNKILEIINALFKREFKRVFYNVKFDHVIHFTGYEYKITHLLSKSPYNKIIFVHADVIKEMETRQNLHRKTLEFAYNYYDKVAIVSEDIKSSTLQIAKDESRVFVVDNTIDVKSIIEKSKKDIVLDDDTEINIPLEEFKNILNSKSKKIITIGRFSPEKGHERLINAFDKAWKANNELYLIIIGGHGNLYKATLEQASSLESRDNIIIIKSISNPFSILKRCDLFVLSSFYEGLGLVMLEADTLGVPVIATRVVGPTKFLEKHEGYIVDNNEDGIYQGIIDYLNGRVKPMNVDYEKYNKDAVEKFERLLKK